MFQTTNQVELPIIQMEIFQSYVSEGKNDTGLTHQLQ